MLLNTPLSEKPEIGANPFRPLKESRPDRISDGIRQLMTGVAAAFQGISGKYADYGLVVERSPLSRLMLDMYANQAIEQGLIERRPNYFQKISVTPKGLQYLNGREMI